MAAPERPRLAVRAAAEFVGTGFLLAAIVGSGIMGERLSGGNAGITLLANSLATAAVLWIILTLLGPISGAHLNPFVTAVLAASERRWRRALPIYVSAQLTGAVAGVFAAHLMFGVSLISRHLTPRDGISRIFSEALASFGLMAIVLMLSRSRPEATPAAVALFIGAAYWFTSSTAFANPAVTIARGLTSSFSGIRLQDIPGFLLGELVGFGFALPLTRLPYRTGIRNQSSG